MIETPLVFARLLHHAGVSLDEILHAIGEPDGDIDFRSDSNPPSGARLHLPKARPITFPPGIPYIAGTLLPGMLRITSISIDERLRWYADANSRAELVVRQMGGRLPQTVMEGIVGKDACEIVAHPVLADARCIVRKAHGNAATLHLSIDVEWTSMTLQS